MIASRDSIHNEAEPAISPPSPSPSQPCLMSCPGSVPSGPSSSVASPTHMNLPTHSVPDFSYSSSEGEDEFYDADEFYQTSTSPKHCIE